jgi:hypothetical protein
MKKHPDPDLSAPFQDVTETLDQVLTGPAKISAKGSAAVAHIGGVVIGKIADRSEAGELLVEYPGNPDETPQAALVTTEVSARDVGKEVALSFVAGDPARPVVLGLIQHPGSENDRAAEQKKALNVEIDGETVTLTAEKDIVLRCGKASITLTRAGKVLIRGTYTSSHSSGVNRIKGGSVQVN